MKTGLRQVKCPYNPAHVMPEERLIWHLSMGCNEKTKYAHLYSTCPYNALHIVPNEALDTHKKICPSKGDELEIDYEGMQKAIEKQFKNTNINDEKEKIEKKNSQIPGLNYEPKIEGKKAPKNKKPKTSDKSEVSEIKFDKTDITSEETKINKQVKKKVSGNCFGDLADNASESSSSNDELDFGTAFDNLKIDDNINMKNKKKVLSDNFDTMSQISDVSALSLEISTLTVNCDITISDAGKKKRIRNKNSQN